MQTRAFGIETEYPVALRGYDKKFYTEFFLMNPSGPLLKAKPAPVLLIDALPLEEPALGTLADIHLFPRKRIEHFWIAENGARFYFDVHGSKFPEYATPECENPRRALVHSLAGNAVVEGLRQEVLRKDLLARNYGGRFKDIFVFRMNTHFAETPSYNAAGCHESYLTLEEFSPSCRRRNRQFRNFCNFMVPFLETRQIFDGAGAVHRDPQKGWQYVISQRIFFIEKKSSMDTMGPGRGFIHFRDQKNGDFPPGHTRLHLYCGDSNMSLWGKEVAVSATHLLLRAAEEYGFRGWKYRPDPYYLKSDARALAADPSLRTKIRVLKGKAAVKFSAPELQREYVNFVERAVKNFSPEENEMLIKWKDMIEKLDEDPMLASGEIDWIIKRRFIIERCGPDYASEKAQFASTFYHDISPRGIYNVLLRAGEVEPFAADDEIAACLREPPPTRAEFRSRYLKKRLSGTDDITSYNRWGEFNSLYMQTLYMPDPLVRSTEMAEAFLSSMD